GARAQQADVLDRGHLAPALDPDPHARIVVVAAPPQQLLVPGIGLGGREPAVALSGGPDRLQVLRRVISGAPAWLAPGATLLVESGADQAAPVAALMAGAGLRARAVHAPGRGATVVTGTS